MAYVLTKLHKRSGSSGQTRQGLGKWPCWIATAQFDGTDQGKSDGGPEVWLEEEIGDSFTS